MPSKPERLEPSVRFKQPVEDIYSPKAEKP